MGIRLLVYQDESITYLLNMIIKVSIIRYVGVLVLAEYRFSLPECVLFYKSKEIKKWNG